MNAKSNALKMKLSDYDKLGLKLGYKPGMSASDRNYVDMKKHHPKLSRKQYNKMSSAQEGLVRSTKARLT